jgi:hypothetical protein
MKSLSEIETTTNRASRAAGFSWGVAEEIGKGIRLLELFGFPGVKNLNQYYLNRNKENFENLTLINQNNKKNTMPICPISLGISFLDQIKTLEPLKKFTFQQIAYPILLLPLLSRGSEIIGKKILFNCDDNEFLLNFNVNISSNFLKKEFPLIAEDIQIIFLENEDTFTDIEWKSLYKISEDTFVEETESLKQGAAGAGLTDND